MFLFLALLHVVGLPDIHTHPSDQHVRLHSTARFNCTATGNGTLTYYWSKDGSVIPNNNRQVLNIQNIRMKNSGLYQCHVRNEDGLTQNSTRAELLGMNLSDVM